MIFQNQPFFIYTKELIQDVLEFEHNLRKEEDFYTWNIDDKYITDVSSSFNNPYFNSSISLLAYIDGKVVGRIDSSMICSHFDGSIKAYLDWICVLPAYRHKGIGQGLLEELKKSLKELGIDSLIAITASNEEARHFYSSIPDSKMEDIAIWIDIK